MECKMSDNLYFKTDYFDSNKSLANFIYTELEKLGYQPEKPQDQDYMYSITAYIEDVAIDFYMGKNDEESEPRLWQIWPEQRVSILKKIFSKVDKQPELLSRTKLETIVNNINGVIDVEWDI